MTPILEVRATNVRSTSTTSNETVTENVVTTGLSFGVHHVRSPHRKLRLEIIGDSTTAGCFKLCDEPDLACHASWHQRLTARRPLSSRRIRISSTRLHPRTFTARRLLGVWADARDLHYPRQCHRAQDSGSLSWSATLSQGPPSGRNVTATLFLRLMWHFLQQEQSSSATLLVPTGRCPSWCEVWRPVSISRWRDPCWMSRSQHTKTPTIAHHPASQ